MDTGTLKRSIGLEIRDGGLTAEVEPTAEYAAYVEYGTRYMSAQPYMRPSCTAQKEKFKSDLKSLRGDIMDPQQELFSALLLELKKQYPDGVYDTFYRRKVRHTRLSIWRTVT